MIEQLAQRAVFEWLEKGHGEIAATFVVAAVVVAMSLLDEFSAAREYHFQQFNYLLHVSSPECSDELLGKSIGDAGFLVILEQLDSSFQFLIELRHVVIFISIVMIGVIVVIDRQHMESLRRLPEDVCVDARLEGVEERRAAPECRSACTERSDTIPLLGFELSQYLGARARFLG